jgi:hypothetical protein
MSLIVVSGFRFDAVHDAQVTYFETLVLVYSLFGVLVQLQGTAPDDCV